ncbi:MAG TPA: hypothetical protein VI895_10630 [Bdellovibrionota bacterium]|nr:hypothetical protein [Bdellovibrionota bacterium]
MDANRILRGTVSCLAVPLLALAVFSTNLDGDWIEDDRYQVATNPFLRSVRSIPFLFTHDVGSSYGIGDYKSSSYRPVTMVSYMADAALFGPTPFGSHLINNALHAFNVLLMFLLLRSFIPIKQAYFFSTLFAVHPMVTDPVSWISSRADLLALAFSFLHVFCALRISGPDHWRPRLGAGAGYLLTVPLSFFSKETAALIPVATFAALAAKKISSRDEIRRSMLWGTAIFLITLACFFVRERLVARSALNLYSTVIFTNAAALIERFLELLFIPTSTDLFHLYRREEFGGAEVSLVLITAAVLGLFAARKFGGVTLFKLGLGFACAAAVPATLVVDIEAKLPERYFYLSFGGIILALSSILASTEHRLRARLSMGTERAVKGMIFVWLCLLSLLTIGRNREWRDEPTLYAASMSQDPWNYYPYLYLLQRYIREGNAEGQISACQAALERKPDEIGCMNLLAVRRTEQGRYVEARALLVRAYHLSPRSAPTSYNIGFYHEMRGSRGRALAWYEQALKLDAGYKRAEGAIFRLRKSK